MEESTDGLNKQKLKFDENDFMRKELAKVRELLEDSEAGKSTQIIDISE